MIIVLDEKTVNIIGHMLNFAVNDLEQQDCDSEEVSKGFNQLLEAKNKWNKVMEKCNNVARTQTLDS